MMMRNQQVLLRKRFAVCLVFLLLCAKSSAVVLTSTFDYEEADTVMLGGLIPGNFGSNFSGLSPLSGAGILSSGNGNEATIFENIGVKKNLVLRQNLIVG